MYAGTKSEITICKFEFVCIYFRPSPVTMPALTAITLMWKEQLRRTSAMKWKSLQPRSMELMIQSPFRCVHSFRWMQSYLHAHMWFIIAVGFNIHVFVLCAGHLGFAGTSGPRRQNINVIASAHLSCLERGWLNSWNN